VGAHPLVAEHVLGRERGSLVDPAQVLGREVVPVLAEQVGALGRQPLQPLDVQRHDDPTPEVAEFALVVLEVEADLLDHGPGLLEGAHRSGDDVHHPPVDRIDAEVGRVGDPLPLDRLARGPGERAGVVQGEGVAVVVAGQHVQRQGGVVDGAGERTLEEERVE
jgi:hypothetical protein